MPLTDRSQRTEAGAASGAEAGAASGAEPSIARPDRWARVKALFLEALQRSGAERSAFLATATASDADLRKEIESLLASEEAAGSFCEIPAAGLLAEFDRADTGPAAHLEPGTRLGSYEISSFIAAGGMGAVYRARHTVLGREVAIKTVGQQLSDDAAKRRLIREARHASLLTHPNICAIHDVGEANGSPFIVMEYVSGKSLGAIVREAVPSLDIALSFGAQIASALEHAHFHGIIHRDLKSSNIVVSHTGKPIVLDFGLAQRVAAPKAGESAETTSSTYAFAGTLSHMAPELLRGDVADVRSDVWALGVLLYELVTGELPFTGRTPFETSSAILADPPRPMRGRVPLAVRLVVERCLMKDPQRRYQTAREVEQALIAVRRQRTIPVVGRLLIATRSRTLYLSGAALLVVAALALGIARMRSAFGASRPDRIATLALLPLEDTTSDAREAYYADGITDALAAQLGTIGDVRVLSRASTARAVATAHSIVDVARQLGANGIARGTVRRLGSDIVLDLFLIRPADGRVLWSQHRQRNARDVLALESDAVAGLADAIRVTMRPEARERLATVRAVSPDVYEAFLKGRYEWNKRTPTSLAAAIDHFTRAVQLDPTYAPAHAGLADCYNQLGTVMLGGGSPAHYRPLAESEAIKALQIDPNSAEAHAALGYVWHYDLKWADAEREFQRAIALNPSFALGRVWYANLLMSRSRMNEALEQVYAARELDPFSLVVNSNVGWILDWAGRSDDAVAELRQTLLLDSTYIQARGRLAGALADAGDWSQALEEGSRVVIASDSAAPAVAMLASIHARGGQRATARRLLRQLVARSQRQYVPLPPLAQLYAWLGDSDSAVRMLDKAFSERSNAIAYLAVDPSFAILRPHPGFQALLARAGLK